MEVICAVYFKRPGPLDLPYQSLAYISDQPLSANRAGTPPKKLSASTMSRHVLIIGGHGRIAQILTQQLLRKSWTVTSLIRSQDQVSQINSLAAANKGNLNLLVRNLEHVYDISQARSILNEVKPDTVVWCAGAGGEARPDRVRNGPNQSEMTTDNLARLLLSIEMLPLSSLKLQSKRRPLNNYFSSRTLILVESDPAGGMTTPGDMRKRCSVAVS
jgi:hypothetical protein